jgi:hypothetical protein
MGTFQAYHTDIHAPGWQRHAAAQLHERGLVTFSGITGRAGLIDIARQLMTIRPHRDADPNGVTVITQTQDGSSGYAGFSDAELIPHTDGSAAPNPPGLLLACQQAADEGGSTRVVDGARPPASCWDTSWFPVTRSGDDLSATAGSVVTAAHDGSAVVR